MPKKTVENIDENDIVPTLYFEGEEIIYLDEEFLENFRFHEINFAPFNNRIDVSPYFT
jgi:hypothetical protein